MTASGTGTELMRGTLTPARSHRNDDDYRTPQKFTSPPVALMRKRRIGQALDDLINAEETDDHDRQIDMVDAKSSSPSEHLDVPDEKSAKRPKTSVENVHQFEATEDALPATIAFLLSDEETQDHCRKLGDMLKALEMWKAESKTRTYFISKAIRDIGADGKPKDGDSWICAGSYLACEAKPGMMVLPELFRTQQTPLLATFYVVEMMMRVMAAPEIYSPSMTTTRLRPSETLVTSIRACCRVADISYREVRICDTFPAGFAYEFHPLVWIEAEGVYQCSYHIFAVDAFAEHERVRVDTLTVTGTNTVECASRCLDELALWRNAKLLQAAMDVDLECHEALSY